jgi:glycosyltransferase involved in cell wall biosynthesis
VKSPPKNLLLATYEYPYGTRETYITDELPVLCARFNSVFILPSRSLFNRGWMRRLDQNTARRQLPENCTLVLPEQNQLQTLGGSLYWGGRLWCHTLSEVLPRLASLKGIQDFAKESVKSSLFLTKFNHILKHQLGPDPSIDLAYSYWKTEPATAFSLLAKLSPGKFRCVTRCHGGDLYYHLPNRPKRPFDPFVAKYCSLVAPVSQTGVDHLISYGFSSERLATHRLGIDLPSVVSQPSSDNIWRIVSCSHLIPMKRVDVIAETLARWERPFQWTHFGDGPELERVKNIVARFSPLGSANLPGAKSRVEIFDFYQSNPVDLFISVSQSEGVPVSVMEALAHGIPILATDAGGTKELVDSQVGSLLPLQITPAILTQALTELLPFSDKTRAAARKRAEELCNAVANHQKFAESLFNLATSSN